jgi:hypothetical protein
MAWEANSRLANQEISRSLRNRTFIAVFRKNLQPRRRSVLGPAGQSQYRHVCLLYALTPRFLETDSTHVGPMLIVGIQVASGRPYLFMYLYVYVMKSTTYEAPHYTVLFILLVLSL